MSIHDPFNAFCRHLEVALEGSVTGSLLGCGFGVKDVFDIAGYRTGNGNPVWLETHPPAQRTASAVERLLAAGARMVGKTHTDEMTYSLNGENVHYGTPINPKAPGRIPGGSSSGSASAVSGGLVDFALGTDCGGSVRLPASYCGIYGIRTTHGLVPADGVIPLGASFDTVGWFAREAGLMRRVGEVLLPPAAPFVPKRLLIAKDAFAAVDPAIAAALAPGVRRGMSAMAGSTEVNVYTGDLAEWPTIFRVLQGAEIRAQHGAWIDRYRPEFGPGIRERFDWTRTIDPAEVAAAKPRREAVARHMEQLLGDDAMMCLPTAPGIAPKLNTPPAELEAFRGRAFALLSIAGLARLPQINLPVGEVDGCPIGLSIIGPRGSDRGLLDWIATHFG
ncbi:MAG TPA: amidase [Candidatus Binataceae bacterium]|nr:amidase [Candidatus Binataceae bacterium]